MRFFKLNQGFSTFDVLTTVSSMVAVVAVSLPIVNRGMESRNTDLARQQIKKLVESPSLLSQFHRDTRSTASVLPISDKTPAENAEGLGLDPWGRPYVSKILSNAYGQPSALIVYSLGPNGKLESAAEISRSAIGKDFSFLGDDIGFIKSLR